MSAEIDWGGGLDALARELELLPDRLMNEVIDPRMDEETSEAEHRIESRYAFDSLRKGLKREKLGTGDYRISNTSPVAHLKDLGTASRFHADGTPTGTMPAEPAMIPESIAARDRIGRGLEEDFAKLRSERLQVTV